MRIKRALYDSTINAYVVVLTGVKRWVKTWDESPLAAIFGVFVDHTDTGDTVEYVYYLDGSSIGDEIDSVWSAFNDDLRAIHAPQLTTRARQRRRASARAGSKD